MLPKDLTPQAIEKLKQTARANPGGSIPANFDPNNFVFHSNTGLTLMLTHHTDEKGKPHFALSMSYPRRPPRDDEAREVLSAFFGKAGDEAGKVLKPEGSNPNVVHYRVND